MTSTASDSTTGAPSSALSPTTIDDHHLSENIHTDRAVVRVQFNPANQPKEFHLKRIEANEDAHYMKEVRDLVREYTIGLGIDLGFQDIESELAQLPGLKYTTPGNGAFYALEYHQSASLPNTTAASSSTLTLTSTTPSSSSSDSTHPTSPVLAGCIALKDLGSGIAEAKRLFVRPTYRGRDLGRLLLVHIIDVAIQAGYATLRLDTLARFTAANKLYGQLGFKTIEPYNYNPEPDIVYYELADLQSPSKSYQLGREEQFSYVPRIQTRTAISSSSSPPAAAASPSDESDLAFSNLTDSEDESSDRDVSQSGKSSGTEGTEVAQSTTASSATALNSLAVGQFLQSFALLPVAEQMENSEHRLLRQEVLRLAKRIGEHREQRKLAAQKVRFRKNMEEQRTSSNLLPPTPGVEGLIYLSPSPTRPQLQADAGEPSSSHSQSPEPSPSSTISSAHSLSPSSSPAPIDSLTITATSDPSSTALTVAGTGAVVTLDQFRPHRRGAHKADPKRGVKPHLAKANGDTKGLNRSQLHEVSRTVRQLRHMGAIRCYVCKSSLSDPALRHQKFTNHCIICGSQNDLKRNLVVPLPGRIAVVTGARIKIGYQVGLKLLRCGVTLLATTRFPSNLLLRYSQEPDYSVWAANLHVLYADLMNPLEVQELAKRIQTMVPHVDILINNAAQTVRRPKAYHQRLNTVEAASQQRLLSLMPAHEKEAVMKQIQAGPSPPPVIANLGTTAVPLIQSATSQTPASSTQSLSALPQSMTSVSNSTSPTVPASAVSVEEEHDLNTVTSTSTSDSTAASSQSSSTPTSTAVGLVVGSSSAPVLARAVQVLGAGMLELPRREYQQFSHIPSADDLSHEQAQALFPDGKVDTTNDHEPLDLRSSNSWNAKADEVDPRELAEVLSTNAMAPFMLTMALKPWLMRSPNKTKYVILVSSMEGKLNRCKEDMHAHTNMAKAALNALTRTVSTEFALKGIYVNSVDTGWNSEERAVNDPVRDPTFETPLDCIDGAARILDPIFECETKDRHIFGQFLKDYAPTEW